MTVTIKHVLSALEATFETKPCSRLSRVPAKQGVRLFRTAAVMICALVSLQTARVAAQEAFVPETLSVKERIEPGPKLYFVEQSWSGASRMHIWGATGDMPYLGQFTTGLMAQGTVNRAGTTGYAMGVYMDRIVRGPMHQYLQVFDTATLEVAQEIEIPNRAAMVGPYANLLQLSQDERYIYIQNATPAASVTVIDLQTNEVLTEVPTPGCWSIYPATSGSKFTSLCGDGTATSYVIAQDGSYEAFKSDPIFDVDEDPLFVHSVRRGNELLFVSYAGTIYRVSDEAETPTLSSTFSITEGVEGAWGVSGYAVLAYNAAHDVAFVMMHENPTDGSHKDAASEVWAVNVEDETTLYRSPVEEATSISVSQGETPVLYGYSEEQGQIVRYEIDPEAKFALKPSGHRESGAGAVLMVRN